MNLIEALKSRLSTSQADAQPPSELSRSYMEQVSGGGATTFDQFHQNAGPEGGGGFWKEIYREHPVIS